MSAVTLSDLQGNRQGIFRISIQAHFRLSALNICPTFDLLVTLILSLLCLVWDSEKRSEADRKESKNILRPHDAGACLPDHGVRCLASKLPNGSQTRSVCPQPNAGGLSTHLNATPLLNLYIGHLGGGGRGVLGNTRC